MPSSALQPGAVSCIKVNKIVKVSEHGLTELKSPASVHTFLQKASRFKWKDFRRNSGEGRFCFVLHSSEC